MDPTQTAVQMTITMLEDAVQDMVKHIPARLTKESLREHLQHTRAEDLPDAAVDFTVGIAQRACEFAYNEVLDLLKGVKIASITAEQLVDNLLKGRYYESDLHGQKPN